MSTITSSPSHLPTYRRYVQVLHTIEDFLQARDFLRLDLPVLLPALIPESYLEIFATEYRYHDTRIPLYLAPSPELLIKRLLTSGVGDCYYLGKTFRNSEPTSSRHSGEFTMLEMYKTGADYMDMADIVLALLQDIARSLATSEKQEVISYQGVTCDLSCWERLTVAEAFAKYADIMPDDLFDHERFRDRARSKGYAIAENHQGKVLAFSYADLWSQIYAQEVEPHLGMHGHPTLIYDYPVDFAALSKPQPDGRTAQRFECYIAGIEIGNCYSELTDWRLQERRLTDELRERVRSGKIPHIPDVGFVDALKSGLPECAGIAIGVERLGMIFTDSTTIQDLRLINVEL